MKIFLFKNYEDLEADLPAFVVVPRSSSKQVVFNRSFQGRMHDIKVKQM